jgi:uncharacterized protein YndB with AHSA1/START domain
MGEPIRATGTVDIAAAPELVWDLVSDVTRMGEWSPEVERCEWEGGDHGPAVGARFTGHNRHGDKTWSTSSEVIESEPGRAFAFAVRGAENPSSRWRYDLEALPDGSSRLTESMEGYRTGFVAKLVRRLGTGVADRAEHNRRGIAETLARIKAVAEAAV